MSDTDREMMGRLKDLEARLAKMESAARRGVREILPQMPVFYAPYEGPVPRNPTIFAGDTYDWIGHRSTRVGGLLFRPGKYGKAIQVAEATTNLILNPTFGSGVTTGWTGSTGAVITADTTYPFYSAYAMKVAYSASLDSAVATTAGMAVTVGQSYTFSTWMKTTNTSNQVRLRIDWYNGVTYLSSSTIDATISSTYSLVSVTGTAPATTTLAYCGVYSNPAQTAWNMYLGGAQLENKAYATPITSGAMGTGYAWTGTAYASTSTRTAARCYYSFTGDLFRLEAGGSISLWFYHFNGVMDYGRIFEIYVDATHYFGLQYQASPNNSKIYLTSNDGSGESNTSSSAYTMTAGWHHIAVTWTSGGNMVLWVDGGLQASATYKSPGSFPLFDIGSSQGNLSSNGLIDDLSVFDRVLFDNEITSIYLSNRPLDVQVARNTSEFLVIGNGDTIPLAPLHEIETSSTNGVRGVLLQQNSGDTGANQLNFYKGRGTPTVPTVITTGDGLAIVRAYGYDGSNYIAAGAIVIGSSGTIAATRVPSYISIQTATDSAPSVVTERLRITSDGQIQITGSVTVSTPVAARAYHSTTQSLVNTSFNNLILDSSRLDTNSIISATATLTGTVQKTAASSTVNGTGTAFLTELQVGDTIRVPGTANEDKVVTAITDNVTLTVDSNFANNASGQTATRLSARLICKTAGTYLIGMNLRFAANATGRRGVYLRLNANAGMVIADHQMQTVTDASVLSIMNLNTVYTLAVNDFICASAVQTSGAALLTAKNTNDSPEMWMARLV